MGFNSGFKGLMHTTEYQTHTKAIPLQACTSYIIYTVIR